MRDDYTYDDMIESYYEGRDILGPEDGDPEGYEKMTKKEIAEAIYNLEDMPNNSSFYKTAVMVAMDLYGATQDEAIEIADYIEENLL